MKTFRWLFVGAIAAWGGYRGYLYSTSSSSSSDTSSSTSEQFIQITAELSSDYSELYRFDNACQCFMFEDDMGKLNGTISYGNLKFPVPIDFNEGAWFSIQEGSQGIVTMLDEDSFLHEFRIIDGTYEDWLSSGAQLILEETDESVDKSIERVFDELLLEVYERADCREGQIQRDEDGEEYYILKGNELVYKTTGGTANARIDLNPACPVSLLQLLFNLSQAS